MQRSPHSPVSLLFDSTTWYLEQTIRTKPAYNLLRRASRTSYIVTVITPHQALKRVQAIVGARVAGVKRFIFVAFIVHIIILICAGIGGDWRCGCARAAIIRVWKTHAVHARTGQQAGVCRGQTLIDQGIASDKAAVWTKTTQMAQLGKVGKRYF